MEDQKMPESRFLCLAVSRKLGGNCIAGIDIDSGKWIRPVGPYGSGELVGREITVKYTWPHRPRLMKPLDVVRLHLDKYVGNSGQPENWVLNLDSKALPHSILRQRSNDESVLAQIRDLAEQSSSSSLLLGTQGKEIPHSEIQKEPLSSSLCVIRPNNLKWVRTTNINNKPRIEGWFHFGRRDIRYCLSLTDVSWEAKLLDLMVDGQTLDASKAPGVDADIEILLTISLGDLFEKTQCHYKLIAGVLLLPKK
jgi:hypothetical protein